MELVLLCIANRVVLALIDQDLLLGLIIIALSVYHQEMGMIGTRLMDMPVVPGQLCVTNARRALTK